MDRREERGGLVRVKPTRCAIPSMKTKITIKKKDSCSPFQDVYRVPKSFVDQYAYIWT